ncbi:MAG TPA: amidohydrolase family protein [Pyrinomonadaceae bacterium]|nr:amidohydrolase family protein [Pyrinomonadaceae bacterium]
MKRAVALIALVLLTLSQGFLTHAVGQATPAGESTSLALTGARIYPSPTGKPIDDGVVLIRGGKIVAVGRKGHLHVPRGVREIDCAGLTMTAGFWNSHVHFIELKWERAASLPPSQLTSQLQEMLTRYGFTSVFDTGSYLEITKALRRRVESGEVQVPQIFSAGEIIFPKGGSPPAELLRAAGFMSEKMIEADNPQQVARIVRQKIESGADAVKIYAQTFWDPNLKIPLEVIKAITNEAHRLGRLVLSHPSNTYGLEASVAGGVDILMHTTPQIGPWSEDLLARMRRNNVSLTPTLKLWRVEGEREGSPKSAIESFQARGVEQLRAFFQAGGQVLFGTDVGYIKDYDTAEEYEQMARAGMSYTDILASLTTNPARRFGEGRRKGRIAAGMDADIVLLASDPATDIKAFSKVRYTLRGGKIIYQAGP